MGGGCCLLATSTGGFRSYCWTLWFGPRVNRVAVGPWMARPRTAFSVGTVSKVTCLVRTSQEAVSLLDWRTCVSRASPLPRILRHD